VAPRARFAKVVLLGNSGGGSLFAFYLAQGGKAAAARLARRRRATACRSASSTCPAADGLVLLAAHLGEGIFMLDRLDPSVIDEANPTGRESAARHVRPAERLPPMEEGESRYAPEFVAEFRAAQRTRCERIDRLALGWCEEAVYFRTKLKADGARMPAAERALVTRFALQRRYLLVYRTLADPRYLDLRLDPSPRPLGSLFSYGRDPNPRQLRRGASAGDERARLALHLVGPRLERGARAHVARRPGPDRSSSRAAADTDIYRASAGAPSRRRRRATRRTPT
jgi:hypothetical protein